MPVTLSQKSVDSSPCRIRPIRGVLSLVSARSRWEPLKLARTSASVVHSLTGLSPQGVVDIARDLGHERAGDDPSVRKPSALHGNESVFVIPAAKVLNSDDWAAAHPANVRQVVTSDDLGDELMAIRACKI